MLFKKWWIKGGGGSPLGPVMSNDSPGVTSKLRSNNIHLVGRVFFVLSRDKERERKRTFEEGLS